MPALTKLLIDAAQPRGVEYFIWCGKLPHFGARIYPTGKKVFIAQVRVGRMIRRVKIGPYGVYTVDAARKRAEEIIRAAAEGRDPQREKRAVREAITVAELCDKYLEAARAGLVTTRFKRPKRPSTLAIDEGRVLRHIKPLIGAIPARDLKRADVQRMADDIAAGKTAGAFKGKPRGLAIVSGAGTAARIVELLGGIYGWADLGPGASPAKGVDTARGAASDRTLDRDELRALGRAIEQTKSPAAAVRRLIALTGLRRGEACGLRWREVDELGHSLRLEVTKTGRSIRPVGKPALDLLRSLPRTEGVDWVFPRSDGLAGAELKKPISAIFCAASLGGDAQSHALRRTFASVAADLGFGDATIAELLGHAPRGVTERHYMRRSDPVMVAAADKVAGAITAVLDGKPSAELMHLAEHRR